MPAPTPLDGVMLAEALRRVGALDDADIDLAETSLLLAALDRPRVPLDRYRAHLRALRADAGAALGERAGAADLEECLAALAEAMYVRHGYAGDELSYDDVQNANLMRVIDRRKGLPVALGILYIATARALGFAAAGVNFPGHFLVRLDHAGGRALVDPFHGGRACGAADLRDLVKVALGEDAELAPAHYAPMSNRDVLLRLQNNIKFRRIQSGAFDEAARVLESMLLVAPNGADLWFEGALLRSRGGQHRAALSALERFLALAPGDHPQRRRAAALLQEIRTRLN